METLIYLLSYLHNLLFLQGFRYLYQFRGIAFEDGLVHIACIRESHNDVPAHLLSEDLKRPRLWHLFGQYFWIPLIRYP
ncbi:MAG: hypothetical protein II807_01430, partial [Thermoguttaceae bacterium]|nr:hypothetical protein [Thermoguttaceae bacterium]